MENITTEIRPILIQKNNEYSHIPKKYEVIKKERSFYLDLLLVKQFGNIFYSFGDYQVMQKKGAADKA